MKVVLRALTNVLHALIAKVNKPNANNLLPIKNASHQTRIFCSIETTAYSSISNAAG